MPDARCTRGPVRKGSVGLRARAYRAAEAIRHSLRNGFTAYSALSLVTGFLATIIPEELAPQELDASTGASGPHAFAVRVLCRSSKAPPHPPQPAPRRDDGRRPSDWDGIAWDVVLIYRKRKRSIFQFGA